jgi:hypothetical protein
MGHPPEAGSEVSDVLAETGHSNFEIRQMKERPRQWRDQVAEET